MFSTSTRVFRFITLFKTCGVGYVNLIFCAMVTASYFIGMVSGTFSASEYNWKWIPTVEFRWLTEIVVPWRQIPETKIAARTGHLNSSRTVTHQSLGQQYRRRGSWRFGGTPLTSKKRTLLRKSVPFLNFNIMPWRRPVWRLTPINKVRRDRESLKALGSNAHSHRWRKIRTDGYRPPVCSPLINMFSS